MAKALAATRGVTFPEPHRARAAAMVITAAEGAQQHLALLRARAADFDPLTRDRFLAGALVPAALVLRAQRFRAWYRARVRELFRDVDVVLAPTTPCVAPPIGKTDAGVIGGMPVFVRAHLGVFTQPLSFIGLPVISVPVARPGQLPIGVQLVGAPWSEATLFRVAAALESTGAWPPPSLPSRRPPDPRDSDVSARQSEAVSLHVMVNQNGARAPSGRATSKAQRTPAICR